MRGVGWGGPYNPRVYHLLLTRRYLTTKILPFLATAAVLVSTMTVIIAWSIMTGFLGVLLNSGRALVGDVSIAWPAAGFGHYEELIKDLESDPTIAAATPEIDVMGMIKLPDNRQQFASIKGIDPVSFARVTDYGKSIWWKPIDTRLPKDTAGLDPRLVDFRGYINTDLASILPQLRDGVVTLRALAKERGAPAQALADLDEMVASIDALPASGKAVLAAKPDTEERRERAAAFLDEALVVLRQGGRALQSLQNAQVVTEADVVAPEDSKTPLMGNALWRYQNALGPIYERFMSYRQKQLDALSLSVPDPKTGERMPAMVLGIEFTNYNERHPAGYYVPKEGLMVREGDGQLRGLSSDIVGGSLTLNVVPLDNSPGSFDLVARSIPIANEIRSGLFEFDKSWVLIDLPTLQRMLRLSAAEETAPADPYDIIDTPDGPRFAEPKVIGRTPARVTHVRVRGNDSTKLVELRARCEEIYAAFAARHPDDVPSPRRILISTWEEDQATLVGAVKKEIVMVLLILGVVSMTVSFLILAIFWAIVREKTRDIGILRAMGASRWSVCGLWLEYALLTGLLGSLLGGLAGCLVVWNINPIHDWMGKTLGLVIWDPRIYYFFEIPNTVDPKRAILVMVAGVVFAVLGALIPAVRAAYMDPVKSLRFE